MVLDFQGVEDQPLSLGRSQHIPFGILQDAHLLEIHLSREAAQLPFHLRAHSAVQGNTDSLEMTPGWLISIVAYFSRLAWVVLHSMNREK